MAADARLLIVEAVIAPGNQPHPAKVMDILMMIFGEGRERSEREFQELFEKAQLRLCNITETSSALAIMEVRLE